MRLFVAIDLGAEVRRVAGALLPGLALHAPNARWVEPEKMHLTLAFLGNVEDARLAAAEAAAHVAAARHHAFEVRVHGAGTFGTRSHPRVLWAGLEAPALEPLQHDLAAALRARGFELEEREFRPHLTLARARDPAGDPRLHDAAEVLGGTELGTAHVRELEVMQSHLSPKGSRYERLAIAPLGKKRA